MANVDSCDFNCMRLQLWSPRCRARARAHTRTHARKLTSNTIFLILLQPRLLSLPGVALASFLASSMMAQLGGHSGLCWFNGGTTCCSVGWVCSFCALRRCSSLSRSPLSIFRLTHTSFLTHFLIYCILAQRGTTGWPLGFVFGSMVSQLGGRAVVFVLFVISAVVVFGVVHHFPYFG